MAGAELDVETMANGTKRRKKSLHVGATSKVPTRENRRETLFHAGEPSKAHPREKRRKKSCQAGATSELLTSETCRGKPLQAGEPSPSRVKRREKIVQTGEAPSVPTQAKRRKKAALQKAPDEAPQAERGESHKRKPKKRRDADVDEGGALGGRKVERDPARDKATEGAWGGKWASKKLKSAPACSAAKEKEILEDVLRDDGANQDDSDDDSLRNAAFIPTPGIQDREEQLKVFVGGLPWRIDEALVRKDFEECGPIASFDMPKGKKGEPMGVAFVVYKTQEGVDNALTFDGDDYHGRRLRVKLSKPPPRGGRDGKGGAGGRGRGKGKGKGKGKSKGKPKNEGKGKGKRGSESGAA